MFSCRLLWASTWGVRDRFDETIAELMGLIC